MLRHALLAAALAVALVGTIAHADDAPRTISVSGHGEVSAVPDIAHVSVGVRTVSETARKALSENSTTMTAIFEALRQAGIADRDMQTVGLSLNPRWTPKHNQDGTPTQVLAGYEAMNQLSVTCRDLSKLGYLLDALADAGANEMHGISFDIEEKHQLIDEARKRAIQDARAKAELLALEAGVELGKVLSISEGGSRGPIMQARGMADLAAVPIAEGEQTISANVALTYEIE